MNGPKHIGWRVVARGACDNFQLEQAAKQAMQMLHDEGVRASWFNVTKVHGREQLDRLPFQPEMFPPQSAASHHHQRGA